VIDFGIDKLAIIGAVALIVIGPERLPRVARTVGVLLGKAQRYVSQVQSEVSRSIELEELKKMQTDIKDAASTVEQSIRHEMQEAESALLQHDDTTDHASTAPDYSTPYYAYHYQAPRKNWRLKRGATPLWYKQQSGVKRHVQSGAARVARFRPPSPHR
jgi:sec-independent protein translocase protein TatB